MYLVLLKSMQTTVWKGKYDAGKYCAICHFFPPLIKVLSKISFSACWLFSLLETCSEWGQERRCWCIPEVLYFSLCIGQDCLRLPAPCKLIFPDRFLLSGEKQKQNKQKNLTPTNQTNEKPPKGSYRRDWR